MNPEKEIVTWWLNRRGFFTINSIKAYKNREIDILAIRSKDGYVKEVQHVEIACSISKSEGSIEEYLRKFDDKSVAMIVRDSIKSFVGKELSYDKVLVVGDIPAQSELRKLKQIKVMRFSDILTEVVEQLDKQNYRNPIIRSLQLVKYLALANPEKCSEILLDNSTNKTLNQLTRDRFMQCLLVSNEVKKLIGKPENEKALLEVLKHSSMNRAEKLARMIDQEVLGRRSRRKFLNALLKLEGVKRDIKKLRRNQKTLKYFLE